jgi:hypothetical protein
MPDIVGNLRIDQAWGSAQVMAALHEVNATYYGTTELTGHAATAWGWAAGAGAHLNVPFISPGDYIEGEINYAVGATNYLANAERTNFSFAEGAGGAYGIQADCVTGTTATAASANATGCHLSTGWSADLSYEHYWTPQWHESFTGAYMNISYDSTANANLCALEGATQGAGSGSTATAAAGCNNNWSYWGAGTRLQWDVTKSFYIGVEAIYQKFDSAQTGLAGGALSAPLVLTNSGATTVANQSNWVFTIRMHKDFLP